jgi:tetratricopeptide (TPR) repeat protein
VEEGNRLFAARQWDQAKAQYELAIKAQPSLAEAHYNLALALEMLGDEPSATKHYKEAANLAPGHKVIWNSPPLRRHGEVDSIWKKENSFLDANPKY